MCVKASLELRQTVVAISRLNTEKGMHYFPGISQVRSQDKQTLGDKVAKNAANVSVFSMSWTFK